MNRKRKTSNGQQFTCFLLDSFFILFASFWFKSISNFWRSLHQSIFENITTYINIWTNGLCHVKFEVHFFANISAIWHCVKYLWVSTRIHGSSEVWRRLRRHPLSYQIGRQTAGPRSSWFNILRFLSRSVFLEDFTIVCLASPIISLALFHLCFRVSTSGRTDQANSGARTSMVSQANTPIGIQTSQRTSESKSVWALTWRPVCGAMRIVICRNTLCANIVRWDMLSSASCFHILLKNTTPIICFGVSTSGQADRARAQTAPCVNAQIVNQTSWRTSQLVCECWFREWFELRCDEDSAMSTNRCSKATDNVQYRVP